MTVFKLNLDSLVFAFALLFLSGCALSQLNQKAVDDDWRLADNIHGSAASPLHRKIFGDEPLDGSAYRKFFLKRVKNVSQEGIGFASCHNALACTESDIVRISKQYSSLEIPSIIRLSFLIHEARHAEGWKHVICPKSNLKSPYQGLSMSGKEECDENEWGAYGTQIVMLGNVANSCTSCTEKTRNSAKKYSEFLINLILSPESREALRKDVAI